MCVDVLCVVCICWLHELLCGRGRSPLSWKDFLCCHRPLLALLEGRPGDPRDPRAEQEMVYKLLSHHRSLLRNFHFASLLEEEEARGFHLSAPLLFFLLCVLFLFI